MSGSHDYDTYVIVCEGLHAAIGPVLGLKRSVKIARMLATTDKDGCQFLPVPLNFTGEIREENPDLNLRGTGQYL